MELNVSEQIVQLPALSRQSLLDLWQKLYGRTAPAKIRRELLVPFLAYKLQENIYGGLKPSTRAELRRIAKGLKTNAAAPPQLRIRPTAKPGTRLFREWRGETHEVIAGEAGYEYRGTRYKSLSQIARKITGARWSGPAFFGLSKLNSLPEPPND